VVIRETCEIVMFDHDHTIIKHYNLTSFSSLMTTP
jgi:hypothetical protein